MTNFKKRGVAIFASLAMMAAYVGIAPISLADPGDVFDVNVGEQDGTPDFDADNNPGNDSGPNNHIIRTNDIVKYDINFNTNGTASSDVGIEFVLPAGMFMAEVPGFCLNSNMIGPETPQAPFSASSYLEMGEVNFSCDLGSVPDNASFNYPFSVKVSGWVPHGTELTPAISVIDYEQGLGDQGAVNTLTVSAAARGDLSKNLDEVDPDTSYVQTYSRACYYDPSISCKAMWYNAILSIPEEGIGASPITEVSFQEDLRPENFYPAGATTSAAWLDAEANHPGGALDKYGPRLSLCTFKNSIYKTPGFKLGVQDATPENSVIDSGQFSECDNAQVGALHDITISNINGSGETCPSEEFIGGGSYRTDRCAISVGHLVVSVPTAAIQDLGIEDNETWTLLMRNNYLNINMKDLEGNIISNDWEEPNNNYRNITRKIQNQGTFEKVWAGIPGDDKSTDRLDYHPSFGYYSGPPGGYDIESENIPAMAGQKVIGMLYSSTYAGTSSTNNTVICDAWDNSKLHLSGGPYGTVNSARGQAVGTDNPATPAWISGYKAGNTRPADWMDGKYEVHYAYDPDGSGAGDDSVCDQGLDWRTDPTSFAGNDAGLAAENVYTAPNRVRFSYSLPSYVANQEIFHSVGFEVARDLDVAGTIIPNWSSEHRHYTPSGEVASLDEIYTNGNLISSTFDPETSSGILGERLLLAKAYTRIDKKVRKPYQNTWVDTVSTTGGATVQFRLRPTLLSSVQTDVSYPVKVEDCMDPSLVYVNATKDPTIAQIIDNSAGGMPDGSEISCDDGELYLMWDFGELTPDTPIDNIIMDARVKRTTLNGTYENNALVSSPVDPTSAEDRSSDASFSVQQPEGVVIEKTPLTPITQVNREGSAFKSQNSWKVEMISIEGESQKARIVDVLPRNDLYSSEFSGDYDIVSIEQGHDTDGLTIQKLFTSSPTIDHANYNALNVEFNDSVIWCDSIDMNGSVVYPLTQAGEPCPGGDVTAVMFERPGLTLGVGDSFSMIVTIEPTGNKNNDRYDNTISGVNDAGVMLGPVFAPEKVVGSSISGFVWSDDDKDGVQDNGEDEISGAAVSLVGTDDLGNSVEVDITSGQDGMYKFEDLRSGNYDVMFTRPTPYDGFSPTMAGEDRGVDSDADQNGLVSGIELGVDENLSDIDAGMTSPNLGSIGDFVWSDDNNNGIQDAGEKGIPGVKVELDGANSSTNVDLETTTDENGAYKFISLLAGSYDITFTPPSGYQGFSSLGSGSDTNLDNNANASGVANVTLVAGEKNNSIDAGIVPLAKVGDLVWFDANGNGIQDAGEEGVSEVLVKLSGTPLNGTSDIELTTTTNSDGIYEVAGVPEGNYDVEFTLPQGYSGFTSPGAGNDVNVDSDVNSSGIISNITVSAGEVITNLDAGLLPALGSIGDRVWLDKNGNGIQDDGEPGVSNVNVTVTGTSYSGANINLNDDTDENGIYGLSNVPPGSYSVKVSSPEGYNGFTTAGVGSDNNLDSDVNSTGEVSVTLTAGSNITNIDAGLLPEPLSSIGDTIWIDYNGNGIQDEGEPGLGGVKVKLSGINSDGSGINKTLTTNNDGGYLFDDLKDGNYAVDVTIPSGYSASPRGQGGNNTLDSDIDSNGTAVIELGEKETRTDIDGGLIPLPEKELSSVGSFVWNDINGNGIQDPGEPGIGGVKVVLTGTDIYGKDVNKELTTNENGWYLFDKLVSGDYLVTAVLPDGYKMFSPKEVGTVDNDSNVDGSGSASITLAPGFNFLTFDIGVVPTDAPTENPTPTEPTPTQTSSPTPSATPATTTPSRVLTYVPAPTTTTPSVIVTRTEPGTKVYTKTETRYSNPEAKVDSGEVSSRVSMLSVMASMLMIMMGLGVGFSRLRKE